MGVCGVVLGRIFLVSSPSINLFEMWWDMFTAARGGAELFFLADSGAVGEVLCSFVG